MSGHALDLMSKREQRRFFRLSSCRQQRSRRHYHRELRYQMPTPFDAAVNANASAARVLGFSDCCVEKFGRTYGVQHFCRHSQSPQPNLVGDHSNTTVRWRTQNFHPTRNNRFCVAAFSRFGTPVQFVPSALTRRAAFSIGVATAPAFSGAR